MCGNVLIFYSFEKITENIALNMREIYIEKNDNRLLFSFINSALKNFVYYTLSKI